MAAAGAVAGAQIAARWMLWRRRRWGI